MINDEALTKWPRDLLVSDLEPVTWFPSLSEAHSYVESLFYNMLAFRQNSEFNSPRTPEELTAFKQQKQGILEALGSCQKAVDLLASTLRPEEREASFDLLEPYLGRILGYCETVINAERHSPKQASLYSGLGIVLPLHTVAARCRRPQKRQRPLELLSSGARRECLWDGRMTAQIATNTYNMEVQAVADKLSSQSCEAQRTIPDDRRVREVKITFTEDRKAQARYVTVENWRRTEDGARHIVEW